MRSPSAGTRVVRRLLERAYEEGCGEAVIRITIGGEASPAA